MANWALVIGIDAYEGSDRWNLKGAVHDALAMRDWLVDRDGGNVAPENLKLLTAPCFGAEPLASAPRIPTYAGICKAIAELLTESRGIGDRFFFHFSGHGLSAVDGFALQPAILASDFSDLVTTNSLSVPSLLERFQATRFQEQFFFIDACRNIPFDDARVGQIPRPKLPVPPVSPQYVMCATQAGVKAQEVGRPGDETGAFTTALLRGLRGEGAAKAWDAESEQYVVRWSRLFNAVHAEVEERRLRADQQPGGPLIQAPRESGERVANDPLLGCYPTQIFSNIALQIELRSAPELLQLATIFVSDSGGSTTSSFTPPHASETIKLSLPPREYWIRGSADRFRPKRSSMRAELYCPQCVAYEFESLPPPSNTSAIISGVPFEGIPAFLPELDQSYTAISPDIAGINNVGVVRGDSDDSGFAAAPLGRGRIELYIDQPQVDESPAMPEVQPGMRGNINVAAPDPYLRIEVADESGRIIANEQGGVSLSDMLAGFYRLRLLSMDGSTLDERVEAPRQDSNILHWKVSVPLTPALAQMIRRVWSNHTLDDTISSLEEISQAPGLKLSTMLALAAGAALEPQTAYDLPLRQIAQPSFNELTKPFASSGLYVAFADEPALGEWADVNVRFENHPLAIGEMSSEGVMYAAIEAPPMQGILNIRWKDSELAIYLPVLAHRITLVVLVRQLDGGISLNVYMPINFVAGDPGAWNSVFPKSVGNDEQSSLLPRIEALQRALMNGRIVSSASDISLVMRSGCLDPIGGSLCAYMALRLGWQMERVRQHIVRLAETFRDLVDARLLLARQEEISGKLEEAYVMYRDIADEGRLPAFRDGLLLLNDVAERADLSNEFVGRVQAALRVVQPGTIWVAAIGPEAVEHLTYSAHHEVRTGSTQRFA